MAVQQIAPVNCSTCNAQFTAPVQNIINGQDAAMKAAFLQGRSNVVQCPQCGSAFSPNTPLLYYDLEKELALAFAPAALTLGSIDQEKVIGQLTNSLVESLPAEQRKYYLLNPKRFLTLESLIKAVLEADGITEEVMQAQAVRVKLLEEFLSASDDVELKEKVKTHDAELDYDFYEMLTAYMQAAQVEGDAVRSQTFFTLRTILSQLSTNGQEHIAAIDEKLGVVTISSQEELLEKLQNAQNDEELEALVAAGHSMLDYEFFQKLTAKIDQAAKSGDSKKAQQYKDIRSSVLDIKAKQEEQSRVTMERAADLLKEIFQSSQPDKTLEKNLDQLDDAFFYILSANIEEAKRQKQDEAAQAMGMIGNMAMAMLQERFASEAPSDQVEPTPQILIPK